MLVDTRIANAVADHLRDALPALSGRVYTNGAKGWDRTTFPIALVAIGRTAADTSRTATGSTKRRPQACALELIVDVCGASSDPDGAAAALVEELSDLAGAVRDAMAGFDELPLDDLTFIRASGVETLDSRDKSQLRGHYETTWAVTFTTIEGRSDAFLAELY